MDALDSPPARLRLPYVLLCALLSFAPSARSADVDTLVKALAPKLEELAQTTPEAEWATVTSKEGLAKLYGLPWPLPETKMTREQLEQRTKEMERSVSRVPDQAELVAAIDKQYPRWEVGDSVEFRTIRSEGEGGRTVDKEQQVKGKVTSIRMARDLAGGGKLDAAVEIDGDAIWKRASLPDEVKARLFADDRAKWIGETVPALRARMEANRAAELAKLPERIGRLRESGGFVLAPEAPGMPERETLTATDADLLLDGLSGFAVTMKDQIYQPKREHLAREAENSRAAEKLRREVEADRARQRAEQERQAQETAAQQEREKSGLAEKGTLGLTRQQCEQKYGQQLGVGESKALGTVEPGDTVYLKNDIYISVRFGERSLVKVVCYNTLAFGSLNEEQARQILEKNSGGGTWTMARSARPSIADEYVAKKVAFVCSNGCDAEWSDGLGRQLYIRSAEFVAEMDGIERDRQQQDENKRRQQVEGL